MVLSVSCNRYFDPHFMQWVWPGFIYYASVELIHITALQEVAHSLITQPTGLTLLQQLVPQKQPAPLQPETQPQESHPSGQPW